MPSTIAIGIRVRVMLRHRVVVVGELMKVPAGSDNTYSIKLDDDRTMMIKDFQNMVPERTLP